MTNAIGTVDSLTTRAISAPIDMAAYRAKRLASINRTETPAEAQASNESASEVMFDTAIDRFPSDAPKHA